jgi:hypothetical protein
MTQAPSVWLRHRPATALSAQLPASAWQALRTARYTRTQHFGPVFTPELTRRAQLRMRQRFASYDAHLHEIIASCRCSSGAAVLLARATESR